MDSGSSSYGRSEMGVGAQPGVQRSRHQLPRRSGRHGIQEEPQVCGDQPWFYMDDQQQDQVDCEYRPHCASTLKDRGMLPTQAKCEIGLSPRDQWVDDLLREARQLCTLFKEQELVTNQINSSMTNLCVQLVADSASQARETTATPMRHDGDRVPECGRGRGRGRALFGQKHP